MEIKLPMKLSNISLITGNKHILSCFHPALVIIDMQNAFISKKGSFAKRGKKIISLGRAIRNIKKISSIAGQRKIPVIYTKLSFAQGYSNAGLFIKKFPEIKSLSAYLDNSFDSEIFMALRPLRKDIVVKKNHYDPFIQTRLNRILRARRVKILILAGVLTNVCVEATARAAFDRGYFPVVVSDATSTYKNGTHKFSLDNIKSHFGDVLSTKDIIKILKS